MALHVATSKAVAVGVFKCDSGPGLEAQPGQVLAGGLGEGLALLGRIDGADPNGDLLVGARLVATGLQGVAIGDGDDQAEKGSAQLSL